MVLNENCRGGSGDEQATTQACDERNLVDAALFAHGYCYVGMGATSRWEKGPAPRWTRRGEQSLFGDHQHDDASRSPVNEVAAHRLQAEIVADGLYRRIRGLTLDWRSGLT